MEGLREALRYRDIFVDEDGTELDLAVEVRVAAAEALADFNGPAVADDLAEALSDPEPVVCLAALDAISKLGMPTAVDRLIELSIARDDHSERVGERAFQLLASYRLEGGAERFAERLVDGPAPVLDDRHRSDLLHLIDTDPRREAAGHGVASRVIEHLRGEPRGKSTAQQVETVLAWLGPSVADRVLEELEHETDRPELLRAVGLLGDSRAVEPIIRGLRSGDSTIRWSAARAAGTLNHTGVVPALLGATQDEHQTVRDAASAALDRMGTAAVLAGLATLMQSQGHVLTSDGSSTSLEDPVRSELGSGDGGVAVDFLRLTRGVPTGPNGDPAGQPTAQQPAPEPKQPTAAGPPAEPDRGSAPAVPARYQQRRRGGLVDRLLGRRE